jgi:geranylgeranyl pyrophosphate synthase
VPALLDAFLAEARARVDAALERWLPAPPACPALVSEAMRYSLFAGGKRLRPVLTLAAANAVSSDDAAQAAALPAACAVEMIHTYSLIHDDLPAMDDDSLRRGRPTLHVVYGDGVAILAGDGLQAAAFALLAREPQADATPMLARKLRVVCVMADAAGATGMVGGQAIDLQAAGRVPTGRLALDRDALRAMHARKTGALIRAAAVSGAVMAGGSSQAIAAVDRFATELGLAFQIVDDILDVEGTEAQLGKTAGKDAADDKPTYPSLYGLDESRKLATDCIARAHAALDQEGLGQGALAGIADWVVGRRN